MVSTERNPVIRYNVEQLQHFIDFFLSPHITSDLPFGEKKIKLSNGERISVPNTIRNAIPTRIIRQYHLFCEQTSYQPLSDTILFDILKHCSASTRKSLAGLDSYSANGSSAFEALVKLIEELSTYGEESLSTKILRDIITLRIIIDFEKESDYQ